MAVVEWVEKEDRAGRYLAGRARVPSRPNSAAPPFARPRASSAAVLPPPHRSRPTRPPHRRVSPLVPRPSSYYPTATSSSHTLRFALRPSPFALPPSPLAINLPSPSLFHPIVLFLLPPFFFFFFCPSRPSSRPRSFRPRCPSTRLPLFPIALVSSGHAAAAATHGSSRCPDSLLPLPRPPPRRSLASSTIVGPRPSRSLFPSVRLRLAVGGCARSSHEENLSARSSTTRPPTLPAVHPSVRRSPKSRAN